MCFQKLGGYIVKYTTEKNKVLAIEKVTKIKIDITIGKLKFYASMILLSMFIYR